MHSTKYYAKRIFLVTVLVVLSTAIFAQKTQKELHVTGQGEVVLKSDHAMITMAVVSRDPEARIAAQKNAKVMEAVFTALAYANITKNEISTTDYNVYQERPYNPEKQQNIPGDYRVSNNIHVLVKNIDQTGKIIDLALKAGANELSNVYFFASDTEKAYEKARILAIQQAKKSAETLAVAAGIKLGNILFIEEGNFGGGIQPYAKREMALNAMADSATPISGGSGRVQVSVRVIFEIK